MEHLYLIHGSYRGYAMFGCRCPLCKQARTRAIDFRNYGRAAPEKFSEGANKGQLSAALQQYIQDLERRGWSDVDTTYNRKCVGCKRQIIPTNAKINRPLCPVARGKAHEEYCNRCMANKPNKRLKITVGTPCKRCLKPMRPNTSKPIPGYPTVQHRGNKICASCTSADYRKKKQNGSTN